jgi:hypothetical protein
MKIEKEKIINFSYESEMTDVGTYTKAFALKRRTESLDAQIRTMKATLAKGLTFTDPDDALSNQIIATLAVCLELIDEKGKRVEGSEWINELLDPAIKYKLYKEWLDYQDSFYKKTGGQNEPTVSI